MAETTSPFKTSEALQTVAALRGISNCSIWRAKAPVEMQRELAHVCHRAAIALSSGNTARARELALAGVDELIVALDRLGIREAEIEANLTDDLSELTRQNHGARI